MNGIIFVALLRRSRAKRIPIGARLPIILGYGSMRWIAIEAIVANIMFGVGPMLVGGNSVVTTTYVQYMFDLCQKTYTVIDTFIKFYHDPYETDRLKAIWFDYSLLQKGIVNFNPSKYKM